MESALKIHNLTEDFVVKEIDKICDEIEKDGQKKHICTCGQCRLDAACYVLNRTKPAYVVSNRGVARIERETLARRQQGIDITVLVYKALEQVAHNQRPYFDHQNREQTAKPAEHRAVFNIPAIVGRVFNGVNFEPLFGLDVELRRDGKRSAMRDQNWQNPYRLVKNTAGTFTFWPEPVHAETAGEQAAFGFAVRIKTEGYETLNSFFEIPVVSEAYSEIPFSMNRTFKLKDMYLFPEGAEEYGD
ncbi:MAG: late competence development ComFB family protein [Spirochaetaceae bacterium]|jgi:competence protein ComFB|nr:late competence development ComFB family protein [Spirochaetaceae bacterium]